jgi:hypothetical protein
MSVFAQQLSEILISYFYVIFAQQLSEVLTFYFYFYVRFRATTGGNIFGIWRVGEEIWVRFFGLKV